MSLMKTERPGIVDPRPLSLPVLLGEVELLLERPILGSRIVRVEADDLLARVTVGVELELSDHRGVRDRSVHGRGPELLAKIRDAGRRGAGPLQGIQEDLGAGVAGGGVAGRIRAVCRLELGREL